MARKVRNLKNLKNLKNLGTLAAIGSVCSILAFFSGIFGMKNVWVLAIGYTVFALSLSAIAFYEMHFRKQIEVHWLRAKRLIDAYQGIKGFLCLDSAEPDAFPECPTVNTLACLADMLYITLMHYRKFDRVAQSEAQDDQKDN